jgi:hypothetical protein
MAKGDVGPVIWLGDLEGAPAGRAAPSPILGANALLQLKVLAADDQPDGLAAAAGAGGIFLARATRRAPTVYFSKLKRGGNQSPAPIGLWATARRRWRRSARVEQDRDWPSHLVHHVTEADVGRPGSAKPKSRTLAGVMFQIG